MGVNLASTLSSLAFYEKHLETVHQKFQQTVKGFTDMIIVKVIENANLPPGVSPPQRTNPT
jgi:hypothetical protein